VGAFFVPLDKRLDKCLDDGFFLALRFTGEADSSESDDSSESEDGGDGAIAFFALALANFALCRCLVLLGTAGAAKLIRIR